MICFKKFKTPTPKIKGMDYAHQVFRSNDIPVIEDKHTITSTKRLKSNILLVEYMTSPMVVKTFHLDRTAAGLVECKLHCSLDHPSILKPVGAYLDSKRQEVCLMMNYYPQGDLAEFVDYYHNDYIPFEVCMSYITQLLSAVKYLHSKGIAHRDIKAENVMLSDDLERVYLTDFGYSRHVTPGQLVDDALGTPYYAAPEIFRRAYHDPKKADVWALGVTAWFVLFRQYPFRCDSEDENIVELSFNVINKTHSTTRQRSEITQEIMGTFDAIFQKEFKKRPSIDSIKF